MGSVNLRQIPILLSPQRIPDCSYIFYNRTFTGNRKQPDPSSTSTERLECFNFKINIQRNSIYFPIKTNL